MTRAHWLGLLVASGTAFVVACSGDDSTSSGGPPSGTPDASTSVDSGTGPSDASPDSPTGNKDAGTDSGGGAGGCLIAGPTCQCLTPNPDKSVYSEPNCSKIGATIFCCAAEVKSSGADQGTACACYTTAPTRDQAKATWTASTGAQTYSNVRDVASCPQ